MLSRTAIIAMNSTHRKVRKALSAVSTDQEELIPLLAKLVVFVNDDSISPMWAILTALRGPDAINSQFLEGQKEIPFLRYGERIDIGDVKSATTAVIRHSLGLTGKSSAGRFKTNPDSKIHQTMRRLLVESEDTRYPIVDCHFLNHAIKAFQALGLSWNEVNR